MAEAGLVAEEGILSGLRERAAGRLYLLGWAVVCKMPKSCARWLFMTIADVAWRRQGPGVQRLEANLARVIGPAASVGCLRRL